MARLLAEVGGRRKAATQRHSDIQLQLLVRDLAQLWEHEQLEVELARDGMSLDVTLPDGRLLRLGRGLEVVEPEPEPAAAAAGWPESSSLWGS